MEEYNKNILRKEIFLYYRNITIILKRKKVLKKIKE